MDMELQYLFLVCFVVIVAGSRDKRLVLHNDQDIHQVISSMQTEISTLKSDNLALKSETAALKSDNQDLKTKVSALESNILTAPMTSGSVYIRWGRTSCPGNGTEMIYSGQMAGNKWNEFGGGSNSLCLPNEPSWGKYVDGFDRETSHVHGTEIQKSDVSAKILFGQTVNDQDVPCAVCRTTRASSVMFPARVDCYPGWTMEYQGYVVASATGWNNNADYVCLDAGLEFSPGGVGSDNEHIIVVAEAACGNTGSLLCPPYANGRELACVVCSK